MSFHGCFLLTWEEKGGGQRAEEGGQRRLQSLRKHNLLIQLSHSFGRSEVKKSHTVFFFYIYIQTAAQIIKTRSIHPGTGKSYTSDA